MKSFRQYHHLLHRRLLVFSLYFAWVLCTLSSGLARAELPEINGSIWQAGTIAQGGLIMAQLPKGAYASLDGTPLVQSEKHYIAFGIHRDDTAMLELVITHADGTRYITALRPKKRRYKTQSISGLAGKYVSPPQETLARIKRDAKDVSEARDITSQQDDFIINGFDWPLKGTITGVYGSQRILNGKPRAPHYGIDIAAPKGTPVIAPADGIITLAHDLYYTGGTVIIDHGLGISSTMLHLEKVDVARGQHIRRGAIIGLVGSTGRSTGPHLDWRINWKQKRLDPQLAAK